MAAICSVIAMGHFATVCTRGTVADDFQMRSPRLFLVVRLLCLGLAFTAGHSVGAALHVFAFAA